MNKKLTLTAGAFLVAIFLLSGCGKTNQDQNSSQEKKQENNKQKASSEGLANPASVYCKENGGTTDIRTSEFGETGYCVFDDGSECEEWSFYQGECQKGEKKKKNDSSQEDTNGNNENNNAQ